MANIFPIRCEIWTESGQFIEYRVVKIPVLASQITFPSATTSLSRSDAEARGIPHNATVFVYPALKNDMSGTFEDIFDYNSSYPGEPIIIKLPNGWQVKIRYDVTGTTTVNATLVTLIKSPTATTFTAIFGGAAYRSSEGVSAHDGRDIAYTLPAFFAQESALCADFKMSLGISYATAPSLRVRVSSPFPSASDIIPDVLWYANLYEHLPLSGDPYNPGGTSGIGGGSGNYDNTTTIIDVPNPRTDINITRTGFTSILIPSLLEIQALAEYMWAGLFDPSGFKRLVADPMDAILGLSVVPFVVAADDVVNIHVGNINTGLYAAKANNQFYDLYCGSLDIAEYWGSYLDYDPYTKIEIYLPYIGYKTLSADDVMGKTIKVYYHIDIVSGSCLCMIAVNDSIRYTYTGQCSMTIPITGRDNTQNVASALSAAASLPALITGHNIPSGIANLATSAINISKQNIEKGGAVTGAAGILAYQTPYITITRPRQALPEGQNAIIGYPAFTAERLGDITGYTEISQVHLENIPATSSELTEIETLLKGGVIL